MNNLKLVIHLLIFSLCLILFFIEGLCDALSYLSIGTIAKLNEKSNKSDSYYSKNVSNGLTTDLNSICNYISLSIYCSMCINLYFTSNLTPTKSFKSIEITIVYLLLLLIERSTKIVAPHIWFWGQNGLFWNLPR